MSDSTPNLEIRHFDPARLNNLNDRNDSTPAFVVPQKTVAEIAEAKRLHRYSEGMTGLAAMLVKSQTFLDTDPEIRLKLGCDVLAKALAVFDACLPTAEEIADCQAEKKAERMAYYVIAIGCAYDAAKAAMERAGTAFEISESATVDLFIDAEIKSVSIAGWNLSLVSDAFPRAKFDDYLPPGVDLKNPAHLKTYALSIETAKAAGQARMIRVLKDSPLSWLVKETVNLQSLRGALVGPEAPRDDKDRPIIADEIKAVVEIKPRPGVRMTKARK